jgi:hypothetical protein
MEKVYIETCGAGLIYESDINIMQFLQKAGDYLEFPGLIVSNEIPQNFPYIVRYIDDSDKKILCSNEIIEIHYPAIELTPASIVYIGYILMEKQRAEKFMATIHSACVEKDNSAILLLGRTGSGKTTLSLDLCINYDYSLIGNDRNVVGLDSNERFIAFDGTKFLFLRYESIRRNLPELLPLFPEKKLDSWLRKTKVLPNELGIKNSNNTPILKSYIIHIDNNQKKLYSSFGDTPANRLYLNELLSMYIRGMYTTFSDKNFHAIGYVPSFDSEEYYKKRAELIETIFQKTELEYVSGRIKNVSEYINEKQKKLVYNRNRK